MSTDIWFRSDIANALRAAAHACWLSMATCVRYSARDDFMAGYTAGYAAALWSVAVALGVEDNLLNEKVLGKDEHGSIRLLPVSAQR